MKFNITDENSLTKIQENIESNADALDNIVNEIIAPYYRDLDSYVLDRRLAKKFKYCYDGKTFAQ